MGDCRSKNTLQLRFINKKQIIYQIGDPLIFLRVVNINNKKFAGHSV